MERSTIRGSPVAVLSRADGGCGSRAVYADVDCGQFLARSEMTAPMPMPSTVEW